VRLIPVPVLVVLAAAVGCVGGIYGIGGGSVLAPAYTGALIQARLPDVLIRRLVGILVIAIGARYSWSGLS